MKTHKKLSHLARSILKKGLILFVLLLSATAFAQQTTAKSAKEWFDQGMLYREAGDERSTEAFKRALQELNKSIAETTDRTQLSQTYTLRARCYTMLENRAQALADLDKAIELCPDNGDLYYLRAFTKKLFGEKEAAIQDLETAAAKGNQKARGDLRVLDIAL